jgi:glucosamine--fructose-6-phosphate aminotransferase (isomerizing)
MFSLPVFKQISGFITVQVFEACEFLDHDIPKDSNIVFIFVSQSGETYDCCNVLQRVSKYPSIGVVNTMGSLLSNQTTCGVYINAGRENGVAATKSFTSQITVLILISMWFAEQRSNCVILYRNILNNLQGVCENNIQYLRDTTIQLIPRLKNYSSMFILGSSYCHSIALEGALKMKELSYQHTEGFTGGALKHGPFALLCDNTPVFIHILEDSYKARMLSTCEEVHARKGFVIVITNCNELWNNNIKCIDLVVKITSEDNLTAALVSTIFYQWLGYELAIRNRQNPDYPRNLAKTVTVE